MLFINIVSCHTVSYNDYYRYMNSSFSFQIIHIMMS